ncbi:MAG TPA: SPOR domain-containing protein [Rhizobacter sp.]|nr:SPOR domain-containing protein [Rhizobacter sp.]
MKSQRGGFFLGLVVGLLVGLALALGVALYIAKVPVPFMNKVPQRTQEQDAAEAEKNKNWDPNSALYGKPASRPSNGASGIVAPPPPVAVPGGTPADPAVSARDPAAILADKPTSTPQAGLSESTNTGAGALNAMSYFVQAGAYGRIEDAEQQRAKLAMMGLAAKVTEREQSGRTVYRVRLGPFDKKEEAGLAKDKLEGAGVESALVQVQK